MCDVCLANRKSYVKSLYVCHSVLAGDPPCGQEQDEEPEPVRTLPYKRPSESQLIEAKMKVDLFLHLHDSEAHINLYNACKDQDPDLDKYPMYCILGMISLRDLKSLELAVRTVVSELYTPKTNTQGQSVLERQ